MSSVDFNFKKLITKSQPPSSPTVSFKEGGQVKLGVPEMMYDAQGQGEEMQPVSSLFLIQLINKKKTVLYLC